MKGIMLAVAVLLSSLIDISAQVRVRGHYRNGKWVEPHYRSSPNGTTADNWSTEGNVNPYTGVLGTRTLSPLVRSSASASTPLIAQADGSEVFSAREPRITDISNRTVRPASLSRESSAPRIRPKHEAGRVLNERKAVLEYQQQSAAKGNAQAQYAMGLRFLHGIDVPKDEEKAFEYLKASHSGGDVRARDKITELERTKRKAEADAREAREKAFLGRYE
jgi:hypothetical protein